jgi:ribosome-binding factor A
MSIKEERTADLYKRLASEFLSRTSNRQSLITVTNIELSSDMKRAEIMLSVMPKEQERTALLFANRLRGEFSEYIKAHSRLRMLPKITFSADFGEQNRQRISELLESDKPLDTVE